MKGTACALFAVATCHRMCYKIIGDHIHNRANHVHNRADHVYNRGNHMHNSLRTEVGETYISHNNRSSKNLYTNTEQVSLYIFPWTSECIIGRLFVTLQHQLEKENKTAVWEIGTKFSFEEERWGQSRSHQVKQPQSKPGVKVNCHCATRLRSRSNDVSSCYATNGLPRNSFHLMAFLLLN